jgi:hypothetical protein
MSFASKEIMVRTSHGTMLLSLHGSSGQDEPCFLKKYLCIIMFSGIAWLLGALREIASMPRYFSRKN